MYRLRIADPPLSDSGVAAEATEHLREAIRTGRFGPGDRIVERPVAEELGISAIAVRDAFARLVHEGWIERLPRRGVRVRRLVPEEVDLASLARHVVVTFEDEAAEAKCPITVAGDGRVTGRWDSVRLKLAVTHLLSNAIKYGAGKPIEVAIEAQGDTAVLRVRDHGPGIAPEVAGTIFHKRFERDKGSKHSLGGLGLGLWLVHQIVKAHEGTVAAASQPGEGSTFTVELPRRL